MNGPVVGEIAPATGMLAFLADEYGEFITPTVRGLAKVSGKRLDILAIFAHQEGRGHFRAFMEQCKAAYTTIGVWHVHNPILAGALKRYGFQPATVRDHGEFLEGYQWRAGA